MASVLIEKMNTIMQELENQALMNQKGKEGLQICLKLRDLKATAFKAGVEWEREHNSPVSGVAAIY